MKQLDQKDRELLALLKQNSRASITTLAADLKVSRATLQSRLERLIQSGTISRFTVELAALETSDQVRAIMMIEIAGALERGVVTQLRRIPEIANAYATNGKWDLVVVIEVNNLSEFDRVLREIRQIRGVLNSDTSILLTTV